MDTKLNSAPRVDELRLQRIKKHAVQNGSWEGMCFALHTIVQEQGQEPYAPLVAVWADVESGMILDHATDRPENGPGILQSSLIRAMEDSGTIPECVGVHTSAASRIVQPVARQLDIVVSIMDELPAVEAAVHWLQTCTAPAGNNRSADDTDGEKKDLLVQVENANYELLALFESWLSAQGLQQSTRVRHMKTVDLFLNSYLMDIGPMAPDEGIFKLDQFFGRWLPKAVPWLSESAVQGMVPGLKKFAVCLHQQGLLAQEDLQDFLAMIKARRKSWEQAGNGD